MNPSLPKRPSRRAAATRAHWQQHLNTQPQSGLTQAAYCREHGLNAKYFSLWKRKLRATMEIPASTSTDAAPAFIPVIVKSAPSATPAPRTEHVTSHALSACELAVKATLRNGVAVELRVPAANALLPLLSQLAQLPC